MAWWNTFYDGGAVGPVNPEGPVYVIEDIKVDIDIPILELELDVDVADASLDIGLQVMETTIDYSINVEEVQVSVGIQGGTESVNIDIGCQ